MVYTIHMPIICKEYNHMLKVCYYWLPNHLLTYKRLGDGSHNWLIADRDELGRLQTILTKSSGWTKCSVDKVKMIMRWDVRVLDT